MTNLEEIRKLLLIENDYPKAIALLDKNSCTSNEEKRLLAQAYYGQKEYLKASAIFNELGAKYEQGYCELLQGNTFQAREIWYLSPQSSPICWGRSLVGFIEDDIEDVPTFLQIRNYLESDLFNFLDVGKVEFVEKITSYQDFLAQIHPETYKYIGRALINKGFLNQGFDFFMKSQNLLPQDPEIYFHLAQYSYLVNSYGEAFEMIKLCLELCPSYMPATMLKNKISKETSEI